MEDNGIFGLPPRSQIGRTSMRDHVFGLRFLTREQAKKRKYNPLVRRRGNRQGLDGPGGNPDDDGDEEDDSIVDDGNNDSVSLSSNCTSMTITDGKVRCAYQRCSIHTRSALFVHEIELDVVHDPGDDGSKKDRL